MSKMYTCDEVAERYKVKVITVWDWIRQRKLNAIKLGREYRVSNGDADVVGLPGVHIECKRVERLNIYDAIEQSKNDARDGENPVVMHRRNRKEWLVIMPLDDWMKMYGKALHDN